MSTPVKTRAVRTKKNRTADSIYPILLECGDLVQDEFWKQFYRDLAIGKGARGVYILNGIIQTSNKRGGFNYSISDKAPEVIIQELHHLLTTYTSICSRKDITRKKQFIKELEDELTMYDNSKWTSIKRKNVRNMLLVDYAVSLKKEYNLEWTAAEKAYKIILNAFEAKTHSSKDIEYEDGKILHINDIDYDEDSKKMINARALNSDFAEDDSDDLNVLIRLQDLFEPYINSWVKVVKHSCL